MIYDGCIVTFVEPYVRDSFVRVDKGEPVVPTAEIDLEPLEILILDPQIGVHDLLVRAAHAEARQPILGQNPHVVFRVPAVVDVQQVAAAVRKQDQLVLNTVERAALVGGRPGLAAHVHNVVAGTGQNGSRRAGRHISDQDDVVVRLRGDEGRIGVDRALQVDDASEAWIGIVVITVDGDGAQSEDVARSIRVHIVACLQSHRLPIDRCIVSHHEILA